MIRDDDDGILPERHSLIFAGSILDDNSSLTACGVKSGATLQLVTRRRTGRTLTLHVTDVNPPTPSITPGKIHDNYGTTIYLQRLIYGDSIGRWWPFSLLDSEAFMPPRTIGMFVVLLRLVMCTFTYYRTKMRYGM